MRTDPFSVSVRPRHGAATRVLACALLALAGGARPAIAQSSGSTPHFSVQFVHALSGSGPLDVYLGYDLLADSLSYLEATEFIPYLYGVRTLSWYPAGDTLTENRVAVGTAEFEAGKRYVQGLVGESDHPVMLLRPDARERAVYDGMVELFTIHGAPDLGDIDVRLRDPYTGDIVALLHNNMQFTWASIYFPQEPSAYNYEITSSDNSAVHDVYHFNLSGYGDFALTFVLSGRGQGHEDGLALTAFDSLGNVLDSFITTVREIPDAPTAFTLGANYPDPFGSRTTVPYSLETGARVRIEILDLLGRVVAVPLDAWRPPGDHAVEWDARTLGGGRAPSGVYLYRLAAGAASRTKSLVLRR